MLGDDIERVTKATGVKKAVDYLAKKQVKTAVAIKESLR